MKKEITTSIHIQASADKIWDILVDFDQYPHWNPFIKSVKGIVTPGNRITIRIEPPGGGSMSFRPCILEREEHKKLSWAGHLLMRGLFDGIHVFEIRPHPDGGSLFVHQETFEGLLVRFFSLMKTEQGFVMMNNRLKELAEGL